jgi:hypothetical protein
MKIFKLNNKDFENFFNSKVYFEENEVGIYWNIKTEIEEYILYFDLYILPNHVTISLFKNEKIIFSISKENVKTLEFIDGLMRINFLESEMIDISLNPLKIRVNL